MFSQACVKNSVHWRGGVTGGACMAGGVCGKGCVHGDMHSKGRVWQGACVAGGWNTFLFTKNS